MKSLFQIVIVSVLTSIATFLICNNLYNQSAVWIMPYNIEQSTGFSSQAYGQLMRLAAFQSERDDWLQNEYEDIDSPLPAGPTNFTYAAKIVNPMVVHINKTEIREESYNQTYESEWGFKKESSPYDYESFSNGSSGSGVIISEDGYIVTNNHVIGYNKQVEVSLFNGKKYYAEVVGFDEATDLALLKMNTDESFPAIKMGDSDKLSVGEWVLAVGNPFDLASTVTAGIVSAKGRDIDVLAVDNAIEAFIQTDAVVNSGNSGGALVNPKGELVGLNTAIATNSGAYAGYSFAVPVNIVRKVVNDIKNYGYVQVPHLGIQFVPVDQEIAQRKGLDKVEGLYINKVIKGSTGSDIGLRIGDIILEIGGRTVSSVPEFNEQMMRFNPGNNIAVTFIRQRQKQFASALLKNEAHTTEIIKSKEDEVAKRLGLTIQELSVDEMKRLGLRSGIRIVKVGDGLIKEQTSIKNGFIVMEINEKTIKSEADFIDIFKQLKPNDSVRIRGLYENNKYKTILQFKNK